MIRINLLPHRVEARKARRERFYALAAGVLMLGAVVVLGISTLIGNWISDQEERNNFLRREITVFDKQIEQIKGLKEQTQALLSRKQVIENLQRDRGEIVYLLNELVKQVPEGIYLRTLKQEGLGVSVTGYAQSNARVSLLMRNLEASPWLEAPQLLETRAGVLNGRRVYEFGMNFRLTRAKPEDGKEK